MPQGKVSDKSSTELTKIKNSSGKSTHEFINRSHAEEVFKYIHAESEKRHKKAVSDAEEKYQREKENIREQYKDREEREKHLDALRKKYDKKRENLDAKYAKKREEDQNRANQIAFIKEQNRCKELSKYELTAQKQREKLQIKQQQEKWREEVELQKLTLEGLQKNESETEKAFEKRKQQLQTEIDLKEEGLAELEEKQKQISSDVSDSLKEALKDVSEVPLSYVDTFSDILKSASDDAKASIEKLEEQKKTVKKGSEEEDQINTELKELEGILDTYLKKEISLQYQKERASAKEKLERTRATSAKDVARSEADKLKQQFADEDLQKEARKELRKTDEFKEKQHRDAQKAMSAAIVNAVAEGLNEINQNISSFYSYQSEINARLQGSDNNYRKILTKTMLNVGMSPIVSQKEIVENIKKLSETGVAYNIELRAFLASVKDDIAQTFDVFDATLLRLIRLQQADSTAARLGMEANLTKLFNKYFSDTSYLSEVADTVSNSLIEANSQLTKEMSLEFEYIVQKWMGSLYSLGMDSNTINTIAQGINYLGSGNVEGLSGNESLLRLMAMSAANAGISIGDVLIDGLDPDTTNALLRSMIEYLQSIASNTDNNQVVKSAYSNVFGFNMSDLTAVSSLSTSDISTLFNTSLNYSSAEKETTNQLFQIITRSHLSQLIDRMQENALATASMGIGSYAYPLWKALNTLEALGFNEAYDVDLPFINVAGFGLDLNMGIIQLIKTGVAGISLLGSLLAGGVAGNSIFDFSSWGYKPTTPRGRGISNITSGFDSSVSSSLDTMSPTNADTDDIVNTSLSDAADDAEKKDTYINKNLQDDRDTIMDAYRDKNTGETLLQAVQAIEDDVDKIAATYPETRNEGEEITPSTPEDTPSGNSPSDSAPSGGSVSSGGSSGIDPSTPEAGSSFESLLEQLILINEKMDKYLNENRLFLTNVYPVHSSDQVLDESTLIENKPTTKQWFTNAEKHQLEAYSKIENMLSTTDIETIASLMTATNVSAAFLNNGGTTDASRTTREHVNVAVTQLSPEVSSYIAGSLKTMIVSALTGITDEDEDVTNSPLNKVITDAISKQEIHVKVVNDNFDTALQKSAFVY